ncbi:BQ5605_C009g05669 [Microbotryum silenes-dioicae]|uniref:BQ5605_C009g05669 protein n=1 Tax=Microbotryum silenes-dioicae TaxID=796604 RepID=A0A2X0PFU0_9BASI|nr:BQ5605_C009g05669 [Microbotryum silenes-dioicae]
MSRSSPSAPPPGTVSYHEPSIPRLLTLSSLIYLLQVARSVANAIFGAGLLGEIMIGVIYGPVAKILPIEWEETILVLGYLGLVLIVFEGGLDIRPSLFVPALPLSTIAALLGILTPLAFTFALFQAFGYPTLHAFTAGSALASTSLGTTFYVLRAQSTPAARTGQNVGSLEPPPNLAETRIGVTLQAAALIDDVVALVLLAVIVSLAKSQDNTSNLGWTIGRPLLASIAMVLVIPSLGLFVARPLFRKWLEAPVENVGRDAELSLGMVVLSGFLAIAYYAGTTMLLGAYLAGVFLHSLPSPTSTVDFQCTYSTWVGPLQKHLFAPFFFASIGFSIPFLQMWRGRIVWRGIVYAVLMALGKGLIGVTVIIQDTLWPPTALGSAKRYAQEEERNSKEPAVGGIWSRISGKLDAVDAEKDKPVVIAMSSAAERNRAGHVHPLTPISTRGATNDHKSTALPSDISSSTQVVSPSITTSATLVAPPPSRKSSSPQITSLLHDTLPAAAFLGVGLIARGEIGVLILQSAINSSFSSGSAKMLGEEAYLVAVWAVGLCTIGGPVGMGWVCRRFGARLVEGPWGAGGRGL